MAYSRNKKKDGASRDVSLLAFSPHRSTATPFPLDRLPADIMHHILPFLIGPGLNEDLHNVLIEMQYKATTISDDSPPNFDAPIKNSIKRIRHDTTLLPIFISPPISISTAIKNIEDLRKELYLQCRKKYRQHHIKAALGIMAACFSLYSYFSSFVLDPPEEPRNLPDILLLFTITSIFGGLAYYFLKNSLYATVDRSETCTALAFLKSPFFSEGNSTKAIRNEEVHIDIEDKGLEEEETPLL